MSKNKNTSNKEKIKLKKAKQWNFSEICRENENSSKGVQNCKKDLKEKEGALIAAKSATLDSSGK